MAARVRGGAGVLRLRDPEPAPDPVEQQNRAKALQPGVPRASRVGAGRPRGSRFQPDVLCAGHKGAHPLLELGLFAKSGKLLVCCPEGYWRRGNVEVICARYQIPAVARFQDLVDFARSQTQVKLKEEVRKVELASPSHQQNQ